MKKYIVIDIFERDMGLPQVFDTVEVARGAMVERVAEALKIEPETILLALQESECFDSDKCEVYKTYAWVNDGNGSSDLTIVELDTETWRCAL